MKKTLQPDSKKGTMVEKQGYRSAKNLATARQNVKTGKIGTDSIGSENVGRPVARRTGRKAGVMTSGKKPETQMTAKKDYSKTIKRGQKQLSKKIAKDVLKKAGPIGAAAMLVAENTDVENFKNLKELERGKMSAGERKITDKTVNKVKRAKGGKVYKCSHNRLY